MCCWQIETESLPLVLPALLTCRKSCKAGEGLSEKSINETSPLPLHLISDYALARFWPSLFGFVISNGRERIHLLPGKGLDPTKQRRCFHVSCTSSSPFPHQDAREEHRPPLQMLAEQRTVSHSQIPTSSMAARAQMKVLF